MLARITVTSLLFVAVGIESTAQTPGHLDQVGLAAKYLGDRGIGDDPAVIFTEDFEVDSLQDLAGHWEMVRNPERMSLADDAPNASRGRRSLLISTGGARHRCRLVSPFG